MFILGFITVCAMMCLALILYLNYTTSTTPKEVVESATGWLMFGIVFIIGSLACCGLYCWRQSWTPVRRR